MRRNPFLRFHLAAEAAAYPALLLVTLWCLLMVVGAVGLLALVPTVWSLLLTMVMLIAAVGIMGGEIGAAFSDTGESDPSRAAPRLSSSEDEPIVVPRRRGRDDRQTPSHSREMPRAA
jgi:hypothetical protein